MISQIIYIGNKRGIHFRIYKPVWLSSFLLIVCYIFFSCKEFVEIEPPVNELISKTVYSNNEDATASIRGIYRELKNGFASGQTSSIPVLTGIYADELDNFSASVDFLAFYNNQLMAENAQLFNNWENLYKVIYQTNSALEGLDNSTGVTLEVKELLEGEARFLRAFCYFYLVNLWGEVPLITNTDFESNRLAFQVSENQLYGLIVSDLKSAQELLPEDYTHAEGERIRVNKGVATSLLSRVYLYIEDWLNAEMEATKVIENSLYDMEVDFKDIFLKNSSEAIWQLKPINVGHTDEGNLFILTSAPSWVALSSHVFSAFESEDKRRTSWVGSFTNEINEKIWHYAFKYKIKQNFDPNNAAEYSTVLRLAEQYLIRAEARARLGNISGGISDVDKIKDRAGLGLLSETNPEINQEDLIDEILIERKKELFTEWGHRWLDLKRTGRMNSVLGDIKPEWKPTAKLWPIPQKEIENNPNFSQNIGY